MASLPSTPRPGSGSSAAAWLRPFPTKPVVRTQRIALAKGCSWRRVVGREANDKPPGMGLRRRRQVQTAAKAEPDSSRCAAADAAAPQQSAGFRPRPTGRKAVAARPPCTLRRPGRAALVRTVACSGAAVRPLDGTSLCRARSRQPPVASTCQPHQGRCWLVGDLGAAQTGEIALPPTATLRQGDTLGACGWVCGKRPRPCCSAGVTAWAGC